MVLLFLFILGSIFGSLINALVFRIREQTSLWERSQCRSCGKPIRPRHLVPIISWLWLCGRCADCHKKIHIQYPLVELLGGLLAILAFIHHPVLDVTLAAESLFFLNLLFLAVFDWRWKLLPVEWMIASIFLFGVLSIYLGQTDWMTSLVGALIGFMFLGLQVILSRGGWMGAGDPWFAAMIGAFLGWPKIALALYSTYVLGGIIALIFLGLKFIRRGSRVAFGPYLALGAIVAFTLWEPAIQWIQMYLKF